MSENSSQPMQIHLFSEQISEQIGRLRLLTGAESNRSDVVAIKRAVMATRLLAGGARALGLESLPFFLEEFLRWLQAIQRSEKPASPTQELILDAVIEFEEELMRHLETHEEGADLSAFQEQIDELRGLIRHNQEAKTSKILDLEEIVEADETVLDFDEVPPGLEPMRPAAEIPVDEPPADEPLLQTTEPAERSAGPSGRETLQEEILDSARALSRSLAGLDARAADTLTSREDLNRLHQALSKLLHPSFEPQETDGSEATAPFEPVKPAPEETVAEAPESTLDESEDPFVQGLAVILEERRDALEGRLDYRVSGSLNCTLQSDVERKLNRVIDHLLEDSCDILDQMLREEDAPPRGRLALHLSETGDRLRIAVRDNGPQLEGTPALTHVDPLGLYRGLRRSRGLIQELHGIIVVEPADQPGTRFVLSLPKDPQHPVVKLVDLGAVQAALPGLLIDEYLSTDGLLFHRDTDGEHFIRNGHPVPLVDLAQFVPDVEPMAEEASGIVLVGSVEKRLGIYCYGLSESMTLISSTETLDGWDEVSTKVVEHEGRHLPLLSIPRLLRLRMTMSEVAEPGSVRDPVLDMYPEFQETAPPKPQPEAPAPATRRVLLVNHSEFRRRELARVLELRGYHVTATCDISSGIRTLQDSRVAFVVSDLRLGREESAGFADLRRAFDEAPVILSTSVERQHAQELVERTGADACWLEPYHWASLHALLQSLGVRGPGPEGGDFLTPAS